MDNNKIKCYKCGKMIDQDSKFCPYCGANQISDNHNDNNQNERYADGNQMNGGERHADINPNNNPNSAWLKKEFSASFLLFWIKGTIAVNRRDLNFKIPNTVFFGLFPAGMVNRHYRIDMIDAPSVDTSYKLSSFIIGILLVLFGMGVLGSNAIFGLILLLLGVGIFANGIRTVFTVQNNSGIAFSISVPFFNRSDIELMADAVHQAVNDSQNQHDNSSIEDLLRKQLEQQRKNN